KITQGPAGQIIADGGQIHLNCNVTVANGTIASSNGGSVLNLSGTSTFQSVTNNADVSIFNNTQLNIAGGSLVNNGSITVNSNQGGNATVLDFLSNTDVTGTGHIVLNNSGATAQLNAEGGSIVAVGSGQTVQGRGQVNAAFTNSGIIQAD